MDEHQLEGVVQQLINHTEALRIYKLLYWTQLQYWENDEAVLKRYPLYALLEGIVTQVTSSKDLEEMLMHAAFKLTKPTQYQAIAQIISDLCAELYSIAPDFSTQNSMSLEKVALAEYLPLSAQDTSQSTRFSDPTVTSLQQATQKDVFELRHQLMREIPPLKAKILLFSVLRHPFTFSRTDWWELKHITLDEWINELLRYCSNFADLEATLMRQAETLTCLDQGIQVAIALSKILRLKYSDADQFIYP